MHEPTFANEITEPIGDVKRFRKRSPKYAKDVRDRMAMFRASKKARKDLRCTFVTVYGVKQNPNSDIVVDQVILDDLFA